MKASLSELRFCPPFPFTVLTTLARLTVDDRIFASCRLLRRSFREGVSRSAALLYQNTVSIAFELGNTLYRRRLCTYNTIALIYDGT